MAIIFPDINPGGPSATSNIKEEYIKVVQLTFADFQTGGRASVKAVLPADASITGIEYWKKTQLSGGGITAATLSVGVSGAATQFINAFDVLTPAAGTSAMISPVTNIMQPYSLPLGSDIVMLFTGTATTGNPTAGEIYVNIRYAR
jgi:hypothetical protein